MNQSTRQNQRAPYSLNQSMTNGLPVLNQDNTNMGTFQFHRRRLTHKYQDSPNNEFATGRSLFPLKKDAEELKEEIMQLKKENYQLKHLNQQLCFQIKLDEKEQIEKRTTQDGSDDFTITIQNTRLAEKLKQARLLLQEKQTEIDNLKKNTRYMRLQEMETELCVTKLKFEFLSKQFNQILKTDSEVNKFQKLTVQTIQLEEQLRQFTYSHQKQKKKILNLRQELLTCQALKEKYRKQYEQVSNEFVKFKKDHEQEIQKKNKYKETIENLNYQLSSQQTQIMQFQIDLEKQRMLVSQKQHQFKELEDQYESKKSWLTNKKEVPQVSQEILDEKVNKNKIIISEDEMIRSIKLGSHSKIVVEDEIKDKSQVIQHRGSLDSVVEEQKTSQVQSQRHLQEIEFAIQKLPRVNFQDVENIGKSLKYQLMAEKIAMEDLNTFFDQKQEITIEELVGILQAYPFNIQDDKQALLLARYLIEDNSQQFVDFTPFQVNNICIIKSVLKNVIGKYTLINEEQYQQIINSIAQQIWKFRQLIVEQIKGILFKRANTQNCELCYESEFKAALQVSNVQLDERQKESLGQFIFKEFNGNKLFDYKSLIDKFGFQLQHNSPVLLQKAQ
ncbi:unnamed protein product (macronuclear) [Paramecium tetraurelia]|uniref:EF-hand domain-containing protein n=1 Tax=Paramecium tetraurelia TaxID=5888 RepID=A0BKQ1_PARTE|nr:uncharacterized protein GSPATT00029749001 [Paramecium tetraurelia]CAK59118.1 unnamed protein product [Paramecium tetraurelia]|eukprot:XP_001426516.1 hypothetical protein (macronuclear) [Paramecium tetraurelia strain d4-2]